MAVEAPTLDHPVDVASHAPHVNAPATKPASKSNGQNGANGSHAARKRAESSEEDEKPLVS